MSKPIEAEALTRFYGAQRGVVDLTFTVEPGEIFGFLGPNGAGKTTTIRQLMGLLQPSSGTARVFGHDCWSDSTSVKGLVGYLPGEIHLYENMSGKEFVQFFAAFRAGDGMRRATDLAKRLELDLGPKIRHLSKGNRQKLAIVQALMHDAPLLIMDEPSSGLDPLKQVDLLELLRDEQSRGKTIFLSSHALVEVERIATRVGIIRDGRLAAVEEVSRLKHLWERRLTLLLRDQVPAEQLTSVEGMRVLSVDGDGRHLELGVHGPVQPVIQLLAELPVEDFTFGAADLESVFLHYYGPEAIPAEEKAEVRR